jgi:hypothetical protein
VFLVRVFDRFAQETLVLRRPGGVAEVVESAIPENNARIARRNGLVDQGTTFINALAVNVVAVVPIPEFRLKPGFRNAGREMVSKNNRYASDRC